MKKSNIALAALLTVLSVSPIMSVVYADEAPASTDQTTQCADNDTECKNKQAGESSHQ